MNPPFGLRPWVGGFWGADTGEQILLPEEPFSIAAPLPAFDGARAVRAAAGDKQFPISQLLIGNMAAFDPYGIGLCGCIVIVRSGTHKVSEGQIELPISETVVQEGDLLSVQRPRPPQPV